MNKKIGIIQNSPSLRPAWIEINLQQLKRNFSIIANDKPGNLKILHVVKDQAYGHGAVEVAKIATQFGVSYFGVVSVDEALELRQNNISTPILLFGERTENQLETCVENDLICCVNDIHTAEKIAKIALNKQKQVPIHVEVDTGMSRYGVRWSKAASIIEAIADMDGLYLEGVMSHFAMSDEVDKSFALLQLERFQQVLHDLKQRKIMVRYRHACNTGGYLDLPQAHLDMVRIGILPLGVYPSRVCRRIPGLKPVMQVKTKIATVRELEPGDVVGYGMHYQAASTRRIAVLPLGYGDGFPRVRNKGNVLIHGKRAPIIGGNAMDAMMVDVTEIPSAKLWDEVVVMGQQDNDEISAHEISALKNSVSYDILAGWRWRLPRIYVEI